MTSAFGTVVLLLCSYVGLVHSLSYSDLQALRADCFPKDSCTNNETSGRSFDNRNCECDPLCHLYNDCCIDSYSEEIHTHRTLSVKCMNYGEKDKGVYAIDKCGRGWRGPLDQELRRKCESRNDISDPLMAAPATDPILKITFKNRYCAECNGVDPSTLESWSIGLKCDSLPSANCSGEIPHNYPERHLIYKTTYPYRNTWGVYYYNNTLSRTQFHPCKIHFVLPEYLNESVRFCRPNIVSTCSPEWRLTPLRRQCESYMAVVYISDVGYRNPHCVLCNNLNVSSRSCSFGITSRTKPSMSFTLLLDVNTRDGNRVGRIQESSCPYGQKYDPFFKRCRALVCALPGYTAVNGRCVRQ